MNNLPKPGALPKWDDLRIVLAIAETGSLSGAGRRLGLSHATAFRRINAIEKRLGARLFDRGRAGYAPTPAGEEAAAAARRIEAEIHDIERRVAGQDLRPSGTVRVTTTDTLLAGLLSPVFVSFRARFPGIALEIAVSNQLFNLSKREADMAIRPSARPPETLAGRKAGTIAQAVYGARAVVGRAGFDIAKAGWVGPDERMAYGALERWMAATGHDQRCGLRVDTVMGMYHAVADGGGLAVLPCYLCDGDARLERVGVTLPDLATDLWLLVHRDLHKAARIRVFQDFVASAIADAKPRLAGLAQRAGLA